MMAVNHSWVEIVLMPLAVALVDQGPSTNQLRYFRKEEEDTAKAIAQKLNAEQIDVKVTYLARLRKFFRHQTAAL